MHLRLTLLLIPLLCSGYDERAFTCLAPFLRDADTTRPTNFDVAFLEGPWAPPAATPEPHVPAFGTFSNELAAAWFADGLTRVHLFDSERAEASFREATRLDPQAAAGYFGLCLANQLHPGRAAFFLEEAKRRLPNRGDLPPVERRLIANWPEDRPAAALESLAAAFPDHVTIQALHMHLVVQDDVTGRRPIANRVANDLQLQRLPTGHPAWTLHAILWRESPPPAALASALDLTKALPDRHQVWQLAADVHAAAGQLDNAIRLGQEAISRQAAAANPAPLIKLLIEAGRFHEATKLCHQLIGMPSDFDPVEPSRPELGLQLLAQACISLEHDEALLATCRTPALQQLPNGRPAMSVMWYEGLALVLLNRLDEAAEVLERMKAHLQQYGARGESTRKPAIALRELLSDAIPTFRLLPLAAHVRLLDQRGRPSDALDLLRQQPAPGFRHQAMLSDIAWREGNPRDAMQGFDRTFRTAARQADPGLPILGRLDAVAAEMKLKRWRRQQPAKRIRLEPSFPALGDFELQRPDGEPYRLQAGGRPVILNYFVGVACPACLIQLTRFHPLLPEFERSGIDFLSITPNTPATLTAAQLPFRIYADPDGDAFRAVGAHDAFLNRPLHATLLVDSQKRILWQTISESPFEEPGALHREAARLLALHAPATP